MITKDILRNTPKALPLCFAFIIVLLTSFSAAAEDSRMDARSRLAATKLLRADRQRMMKTNGDKASSTRLYTSMIVRLTEDRGLDELKDMGAVIFHHRGDMALVCMPRELVGEVGRSNYVDRLYLARKASKNTDVQRAVLGSGTLQNGTTEFPSGLDGSGVVTGICDIGIDPFHIAFRNRLWFISTYVDSIASRKVWAPFSYYDTGAIRNVDTYEETHGTHVLNILGGGYKGNSYYGGAPGSILACSRSNLTDVSMLSGIEDIIAYAKELGKPAVINVSAGEYLGPHDGTDLFNRYLDLLCKEALICFSAGNNGHRQYSLRHTLGDGSPSVIDGMPAIGSMFESSVTWNGFGINGAMDIWSADTRSVDIRFVAYDQVDKRFIYRSPWYGPNAADTIAPEGAFSIEVDKTVGAETDSLRACLAGTVIEGAWETCPDNGRFNLSFDYSIGTEAEIPGGNHWARYIMGWEVRGAAGTSFDAYTDGLCTFMRRYGVPGMVDGNADGSISNLCCGHGVFAVGSWNDRNEVPVWQSDNMSFSYEENTCSNWSSYGTLRDGRVLPHFCAPGNTVVSAMSSYYYAAHPNTRRAFAQTVNGREYSWYEECGTSMASPAAASVLALWAQAYPKLTTEEAHSVIAKSSSREFKDIDDPRWGAGSIDAVEGLTEVIDMAGIGNISVSEGHPVVTVTGNTIRVIGGDGSESAFDIQGRPVALGTPLAPGIYLVKTSTRTVKVLIHGK